jgi:hypothetical protein
MIADASKDKFCPHVQNPLIDCYCSRLGSAEIEKTIYYCGNNFTSCEIYKDSFATLYQRVQK